MIKNITLKVGQKVKRKELEKQGWVLLMNLPNGNEIFSRNNIKIMWDPEKEEIVHLFTSADTYRHF
ncbi:MAG TPA: hypothetical protein VEF33_00870 [Syntrophales bacterium]|nr:hypothetical protein [Syntrophales bacterium]